MDELKPTPAPTNPPSPLVQSVKHGLFDAGIMLSIGTTLSLLFNRGPRGQVVAQEVNEAGELVQRIVPVMPKFFTSLKEALAGNSIWAIAAGLFGGFSTYERIRSDNAITGLQHENQVLHAKLDQAGSVLQQVATQLDASPRFTDRLAAEKAEAAEATPQIH